MQPECVVLTMTHPNSRPAIEAIELTRSLPLGGESVSILKGVSFTVDSGEWIARRNLRRQPMQALVALVALFCGVFTIGFAAATISNGRQRLSSRELPKGGYNIAIYAAQADAGPVAAVLEREGVKA